MHLMLSRCRMFTSHSDYMKANEKGEFEVAKGLSSAVFKIIMVSHVQQNIFSLENAMMQNPAQICKYKVSW